MSKLSALTGAVLLAAGLFPAVVSASVPAAPVCKETVRDPKAMIQRMNATTKAAIWYKLTGSTAVQPGSRKI